MEIYNTCIKEAIKGDKLEKSGVWITQTNRPVQPT